MYWECTDMKCWVLSVSAKSELPAGKSLTDKLEMLRKEKGERWLSIFDSERKLRTDEVKEGGGRKKKAMSRSDSWGGSGAATG